MQNTVIQYKHTTDPFFVLFPLCSVDISVQGVEHGKNCMLRIINAALNDKLFFGIEDHTLTVVEIDATYVKNFTTSAIMVAPGQTTNVLLTADHASSHSRSFTMAASPYVTATAALSTTAPLWASYIMKIRKHKATQFPNPQLSINAGNISLGFLPEMRDTIFNTRYSNKLRSLATSDYPCKVPKIVDKQVFLTISLNLQDCPLNQTCKGYLGKRFSASINNQSLVRPTISILESHHHNRLQNDNIFSDFPEKLPHRFNYTGASLPGYNINPEFGTKVLEVPYGTRLEFVLQDTTFINADDHPIHIHGHNFFVVGSGFGKFDLDRDREGFDPVDTGKKYSNSSKWRMGNDPVRGKQSRGLVHTLSC